MLGMVVCALQIFRHLIKVSVYDTTSIYDVSCLSLCHQMQKFRGVNFRSSEARLIYSSVIDFAAGGIYLG